MKKLKILPLVCVFLALFLSFGVAYGYEIEGRKVYEDSAKAYISAYPHTMVTGDDFVKFEIMTKTFSGNIDIIFGYNSLNLRPKKVWLYNNSRFFEVSDHFEHYQIEYADNDNWYKSDSVYIEANNPIVLIGKFQVLTQNPTGKYDICAKPSHLTIQEAISSDNFLCLDPWYNISYTWKFPINASTSMGTVTMPILLNDTFIEINGQKQYIWCNYTVNETRSTVGYLYYNNETHYECVDSSETYSVAMDVGQGNGTDKGIVWDGETIFVMHLNGTDYVDKSIYGNDGYEAGNPLYVDGKIGNSIKLDGDDYIFILDSNTLDGHTHFTASVWLNGTQDVDTECSVCKHDSGDVGFQILRNVGGAGKIYAYMGLEGSGECGVTQFASVGTAPNNVWTHVVMTFNQTDVCLYLNGVLDSCTSSGGTDCYMSSNEGSMGIGARNLLGDTNANFTGELDDVRLYNKTLNREEIMALYNNTVYGHNFAPLGDFIGNLPPSQGNITYPLNGSIVSNSDFINWTGFIDPEGATVTYNVSLYNLTWSYNETLTVTTNEYVFINWNNLSNTSFYLVVEACDPLEQCVNDTITIRILIIPPYVEPPSNITPTYDTSAQLPIKYSYCSGDKLVTVRERFICFQSDCATVNQTETQLCNYGCEENLTIYGADCIPTSYDTSIKIFMAILSLLFILFFMLPKIIKKGRKTRYG